MATLQEHWQDVSRDERFLDLPDDKKEKVRQRLWDQYVQTDSRYLGLPESKRITVRQRFDDMTNIQPESTMDSLKRKGKKLVKEVQPAIDKAKLGAKALGAAAEAGASDIKTKVKEGMEDPYTQSNVSALSPGGENTKDIPALSVGGKEIISSPARLAQSVEGVAGAVGDFIEPSEEKMISHVQNSQEILSDFDKARLYASGAVRTVGDFAAGLIPRTNIDLGSWMLADTVFKVAGTTFLGRDITNPFKPKTGLSATANTASDAFEKAITQKKIDQGLRKGTMEGPPKPLEILANKEAELKAQGEVDSYKKWLEDVDKLSPSGGEPQGDLYPAAKSNVTQLRDMAQERLDKLRNEPVRVTSISRAEDELSGYYRRRIDNARVWMMPGESQPKPQTALPEGPKPSGLLESGGEPPQAPPERPESPPPATNQPAPKPQPTAPQPTKRPAAAPVASQPSYRAKDVLTKMYSAYYPEQSKQAIAERVGVAMKSFGFKQGDELSLEHMNMLDRFVESEHQTHLSKAAKAESKAIQTSRLKEKGMDPIEVRQEASRLQSEHEASRGISDQEKFIQGEGGLAMDPKMKEEHLRNVPLHLRGTVTPDDMAQRLFENGFQKDPSANTMYEMLSRRKTSGKARSVKSFLDEAEHNLEMRRQMDAGFIPEDQSFRLGEQKAPGSEPVVGTGQQDVIPGTERQFGEKTPKPLFDIKQAPASDLLKDIWDNLGEKGGIGGEIDPVKQAAMDAAMKELVDRAVAMGYQNSQDILLYAARNAPTKEIQAALTKNLAPTLTPFDDHAYKEIDAAKDGNVVAQKSLMDRAQKGYFREKAEMIKGTHKKWKANQAIARFKDGDEAVMKLKSELFIHDNYRKFSKDELAAQMWYGENKSPKLESLKAIGVPEEDAKKWLDLAKKPTPQMVSARKMTQIKEDEAYDFLSQFYEEMGYVKDHVTHRWKDGKQYLDWEGRTLANRPNFSKGRKLVTQADGIDAGFRPESFSIKDDIKAMDRMRINIMSKIHAFRKLGASLDDQGLPALMNEAEDGAVKTKNALFTPHSGTAPKSWLRPLNVPMLNGMAINPYYKEVVEYMLARPWNNNFTSGMNWIASSTKQAKLIGLFHGFTQGEMILSGVNYRNVFSFAKDKNTMYRGLRYLAKAAMADMEGTELSKNPIKAVGQVYSSYMRGHGILANRPLALELAEHRFCPGSVSDDMHSVLSRSLIKLDDMLTRNLKINPIKGITLPLRTGVDLLNKTIFDYMRTIGSMIMYEDNVATAIKKFNLDMPEGKKIPIDEIKSQIGEQISNGMGGTTYAQFMAHPKTQQTLQWLLLAPEWTIRRPMMAGATLLKGPQGSMARKQMAKLFLGWYVISNMINYNNTKKYLGKGRWMHENPEGYRDQAFRMKDSKGTSYYQLSKALTEIADYMHPARTLSNKASPIIQSVVKVMNWAHESPYYADEFQRPGGPAKIIGEAYNPMFVSGQSAYGGLPMHKGPSRNYVMGMLEQYYRGGQKDRKLYKRAYEIGDEQGFDVSSLESRVSGKMNMEENRNLFK